MPQKKRLLDKSELEAILLAHPGITLAQLKTILQCGSETIARELERHGLKTLPWSERKHSTETRAKISHTRIEMGLARGENNPNHGDKSRPWLEGEANPLRRWHRENPDFGDRQRGVANPVHRVDHLYDDPVYVGRITRGLREHSAAKANRSYEDVYGVVRAAAYKAKLRAASPARLAKFHRAATEPEKRVAAILETLRVEYLPQHAMGFYTVDFFVPSSNLVVQADGDYWHANPATYPTPSRTQQKQRRLDHSCDSYLSRRGFTVVRLWESDLRDRYESCVDTLRRFTR